MRCLKNAILRTLMTLNAVSFIIFGCMLGSESSVPMIICGINVAWLLVFFWINDDYFNKEGV